MATIKTYTVLRKEGAALGPYSYKGLILQFHGGKIKLDDLVTQDGDEKAVTLSELMAAQSEGGQSATETPIKEKTAVNQTKPAKKAILPPIKQRASSTSQEQNADKAVQNSQQSAYTAAVLSGFSEKSSNMFYLAAAMTGMLALLHAILTISVNSQIMYETDFQPAILDFENFNGIISGFRLGVSLIAILFFFIWLAQAVKNARQLSNDKYIQTPSSIIITFFIPVYHIWAVYGNMRNLLNISTWLNRPPNKPQRLSIAFWWLSFWMMVIFKSKTINNDPSTVDDVQAYFGNIACEDFSVIVFSALSCLIVFCIHRVQKENSRLLY